MKSSLLTATGCLAVVMFAATTASAQTHQSSPWNGYRGGNPDWSSYGNNQTYQYSQGNTQHNPYAQPYGSAQARPAAGSYSYNAQQYGSYAPTYGSPQSATYGQPQGNQYRTPPTTYSYSTASGPAAQTQPSVPGPQPMPEMMQPGYGSVADTYDASCDAGGECDPCQTKPVQWMVSADALYLTRPAAQILFTIGDHFEGLHIQRGRSR